MYSDTSPFSIPWPGQVKSCKGRALWPGSLKATGREPKTCLGRPFNNKLGCFDDVHEFIYVDERPHL
jgi:hypothetical protein